jgi:hypothetical protein
VGGTPAPTWVTVPAAEAPQTFSRRVPVAKPVAARGFKKVMSPGLMAAAVMLTFTLPVVA